MPSSMSTVRCVGRSFVVHRERAAPFVHGAVVDDGDAGRSHALAHEAREGRGLLAIEVAFEAMADRLVEQNAGPAGPEHHLHLARWRRLGRQVDQRLTERLVDAVPPLARIDIGGIAAPAARAMASYFLAVAFGRHDRDIEADERAHIEGLLAARAHDLDHLPFAGKRAGDLLHARILGARIGVDLLEKPHFVFEGHIGEGIVGGVERNVGARGRHREHAGIIRFHRLDGAHRAPQGVLGKLGGMGIARGFPRHGAQAEALHGIVARRFQAAIVEGEGLRQSVFEKELAVIGAHQRVVEQRLHAAPIETGFEKK